MPRTGTGPFPAQRSGFPVPGGHYGLVSRDTQFSGAPYGGSYGGGSYGGGSYGGGSYGAGGSGQYGLAVPGSYFSPVAAPDQYEPNQYEPAQYEANQYEQDQDEPAGPAQWPLQSRLDLGALPGAVPCARLHARLLLTEWGQAVLGDSVELIVSELMTNALRASTDPVGGRPGYGADGRAASLGLRLASDRRQVLVEVWDGATAPPVPGQISRDGETGRGLLMVEAVSSRWGYYYPARQPRGTAPDERAAKVVWALIQPGG